MKKIKSIIMLFLLAGLMCNIWLITPQSENSIKGNQNTLLSEQNEEINLTIPKISAGFTEASIHIDANWSDTANDYDWCYKQNGIYIIENVTVDAGGSGSAIFINNTNDYFIIRNCTLFNSGGGVYPEYNAGIKLSNVRNGTIINNNCSENGYFGVGLANGCRNITITRNNFSDNGFSGIRAWSCYDITISNNTIDDSNLAGIEAIYSDDVIIANNTFDDLYSAMYIYSCENPIISANEMIECGIEFLPTTNTDAGDASIYLNNTVDGKAVYYYGSMSNLGNTDFTTNGDPGQIILGDCSDSVISGFTISSGTNGVSISFCQNITVEDNEIHNLKLNGIYGYQHCDNNIIKNNNITSCNYGINIGVYCDRNLIYNNTLKDNDNRGIEFSTYSNNNNITKNWLEGNGIVGSTSALAVISYCNYNNITDNTVISNRYGIEISSSSNNRIFNNTANDNEFIGIHIVRDSHDNTILNNSASETLGGLGQNIGIRIEGAGQNPTGNNATGNICNGHSEYGIQLLNNADENYVINNTLNNNAYYGILLQNDCDENNITENVCNGNNQYGIFLRWDCDSNFVINNTAHFNGIVGIYLEGHAINGNPNNNLISENRIYDNDGYGIALFVFTENNHITDNIVKERFGISYTQYYGIYMSLSSNYNNITGNTISGHAQPGHAGIYIDDNCGYNNVSDNTVFDNYFGIYLHGCENNTIHKNTAIDNLNASIYLHDGCKWNNISANTFNNSKNGVYILDNCQNNNFMFNIIGNNTIVGVFIANTPIDNSDGNLFYGNFFLNNTEHAWDDPQQNQWQSYTYEIGNYWDDYTGEDKDDNGIGDQWYYISNSTGSIVSEDRYPIWWDGQDVFPPPPPSDGDDDDDDDDGEPGIPFGNFYLIFLAIGIVGLVFYKKRKIKL